jgi:hypothetical protein
MFIGARMLTKLDLEPVARVGLVPLKDARLQAGRGVGEGRVEGPPEERRFETVAVLRDRVEAHRLERAAVADSLFGALGQAPLRRADRVEHGPVGPLPVVHAGRVIEGLERDLGAHVDARLEHARVVEGGLQLGDPQTVADRLFHRKNVRVIILTVGDLVVPVEKFEGP